jgi:dienelactone hydrolase
VIGLNLLDEEQDVTVTINSLLGTKRLKIVVVALLAGLMCFIAATALSDGPLLDAYEAGLPTEYNVRESTDQPGFRREVFTFVGEPGTQIPVLASYPTGKEGPFPCVIMLYGYNQNKEILDIYGKPFVDGGFALVIPDQYTRGERTIDGMSGLQGFLSLGRRAALNLLETRRLIDTLVAREDIDAERIYLWGLSFGAMCGASIMADEPRLKAAVFTVGAGDLNRMFRESPALDALGAMKGPVSELMASLLKPLEPTLYIHRISPRPVLFQNALQDQIIPRACAEALHNAAGEPKKVIWYDVDHEGTDKEHILQIMSDGVQWLKNIPKAVD